MTSPVHRRGTQATPGALAAAGGRWEALARAASWLIPGAFVLGGLADELLSRTRVGPDFGVYHRAAVRFVAGEPLYRLSDGHLCFKYSPAAAALLAPLAALPARPAQMVFSLLSAASLLLWIRWASRFPAGGEGPLVGLSAALFLMPLYTLLFFLGQVDAILLALVLASEVQAERRPWLSGALWAVALLFKPPMIILLVTAVLFGQWRRIASAAASTAALLGGALLRYGSEAGWAELRGWRALLATTTPPILCDRANQSVFAVACTYLGGGDQPSGTALWAVALGGTTAAALAVPTWRVLRADPRRGRPLAFAVALYLAAFLSPLGWRVNLLALLPLLYLLAGVAQRASTAWLRALALAVGLLWIAGANLMSDGIIGHPRVAALEGLRFAGLSGLAIALVATWGAAAVGGGSSGGALTGASEAPPGRDPRESSSPAGRGTILRRRWARRVS